MGHSDRGKEYECAFLTGASSGIGAAVARRLAARGTRVVLAARRVDLLDQLRGELVAAGGAADVCELDVSDTRAVRAAWAKWDERVGGFDLVLANAGVGDGRPAQDLQWEHVERVLEVNVMGAFATLMSALPDMLRRGTGTLAGVSSLAGMRGMPTSGAYSASKAALSSFLETLDIDLGGSGLAVVDIRPGFVDTPMTQGKTFTMPFLWTLDRAADCAVEALLARRAICSFPWPLTLPLRISRGLPESIWRWTARRMPARRS